MSANDSLGLLREEQRRRFEAAKREGNTPEVRKCDACQQPTYSANVCPASGLFHDLDKKKLIGGSVVTSNVISSSQLMAAIDQTRVKWVPSRTQLVKVDAQSINIFQSFVAQMDWKLQRYAILYGLYDDATHTIEVHAVYEPEQHGSTYTFEPLPDAHLDKVEKIAKALGLRRVGVACTHPMRDPEHILLNFRELLLCAKEQSRYGDECALLTVAPAAMPSTKSGGTTSAPGELPTGSAAASSGPTLEPTIVVSCQAWQTSPQCVHLYRLGVLQESSGGEAALQDVEQARQVHCTMALEVAQTDTDPRGHQRFVTKAPSTEIDTRWFTSYIAVQQFESPIVRGAFMRLSRPGMPPPVLQNLRNYIRDPKRKSMSFAETIADFHVLVYLLTQIFTSDDELRALCSVARTKMMTEEAANYQAILLGMMSA
ncbi:NPL4 [Leishmania donovani]|uniref:NPL4_family_-_putative n=4 Tax=Leishmania donovani species complex TaxID=38574 RepID=A0A6L0XFC0_LEIIN|nr:NPL4 family, putative [Leishmania donovani]CAC9494320.1 NPL4_family_-_putative [Leishmania infantum]TPP40744.1 NPL4 family protein [Leishmania donovani]TPP48902.1 NPL4 family protein [Leishmania donovani]CAJ1989457.1 NPL4 [Leishmania donovani]